MVTITSKKALKKVRIFRIKVILMDIMSYLIEKKSLVDQKIEEWIPREFDKNSLTEMLGETEYEYDVDACNQAISKPIWDLLDRGGKRWRPLSMLLIIDALGKDSKEFLDFVVIPECVHNGTLMVDDIEDNSDLRRGKPCTHKKFGVDIAINAGNGMYYLPLTVLLKNKAKLDDTKLRKLYETYTEEMIKISFGQGMDIAWHNGLSDANNLSEKEYLQMCAFKTGTLARMSGKFGAILADASEDAVKKIGKFAETIGVAFQIQDDILNINPGENWGKDFGDDINEGKRTLMVIHTLKNATEEDKERLIEILDKHTQDKKEIIEAIQIIKKYKSIEYAKEYARNMVAEAWDDIKDMIPNSPAKETLKSFADFLVERDI